MALITLGTNATTSLNALAWNSQSAAADIASIVENILSQPAAGTFQRISPGAFQRNGRLRFPGREGWVNLLPGDYVAYDGSGWPIFVSSYSIANSSSWAHS